MAGDEATTQALSQISRDLRTIHETQVEHGKTLTRLDERSQQHEKRMNRADKRSGAIAGTAGALVSGLIIGLKMLISGGDR